MKLKLRKQKKIKIECRSIKYKIFLPNVHRFQMFPLYEQHSSSVQRGLCVASSIALIVVNNSRNLIRGKTFACGCK